MKKIAILLSVCLLLSSVCIGVNAATVSSECDISDIDVPIDAVEVNASIGQTLDIKAESVILLEPYTKKILYESNADEKLSPASITKIMSLLLVMEAIERGDISLETVITASEHACSMGGSQIWLEPGESMTVDDLLKATVIASANDACVALGEAVAGSEEGFVALMNSRAKELGMTNTTFINCTGLDAEGHLTSAYDVAIMSAELIKFDLIKKYSTVWMDSLRDGESELVNTNKLVRFYEGTTGLKTGTTSIAKYCLSATAKRNGMELVAVVLAGETSADRFNGAKKLLDYGFANYNFTKMEPEIKDDATVKVNKGTKKEIKISAEKELNLLLPKNSTEKIVTKTEIEESVTAPVKKGDRVGTVSFYQGKEKLGEIPVVAAENSKRISFGITFGWIAKGMFML